jgi:hypothetical protein
MRPFTRFWNRLSYKRWLTLEDSVRIAQGIHGEFNFTAEEQKIFSEGVESFSADHTLALAAAYDFSRHRRVLDLGGGTGSFLKMLWFSELAPSAWVDYRAELNDSQNANSRQMAFSCTCPGSFRHGIQVYEYAVYRPSGTRSRHDSF